VQPTYPTAIDDGAANGQIERVIENVYFFLPFFFDFGFSFGGFGTMPD